MIRLMKQVRFKILPSAMLDAVARHPEDLEMKSEAVHALWSYTGIGGGAAQQTVMDSGPIMDILKQGLTQAIADTASNYYEETIRKFVGCTLSLAKDNKSIQDALVEAGLRNILRKTLSENQNISFQGEFASLRDWIRGDRGGAKSVVRGDKSTTRIERNRAENALNRGIDEDTNSPVTHLEAMRLFDESKGSTAEFTQLNPIRVDGSTTKGKIGGDSMQANSPTAMMERVKLVANDVNSLTPSQKQTLKSMTGGGIGSDAQAPTDVSRLKEGKKEWTINEAINVLNARDPRAHFEASEALAEMFANEPTLGVAIVLNGGVPAIAKAMGAGNAAFGAGACALLHMLTTSDLTRKRIQADEAVINGSLFNAILVSMSKFPRNAALQQWAGTAIWALIKDNSRGKTAFMKSKAEDGSSGLRVLKNALTQFGGESEATARAIIGCTLALAVNSITSQKKISNMAMPHLILDVLAKHPTISYRGEFDMLREWLRDNASRTQEIHDHKD
jgi:hypothetical protein